MYLDKKFGEILEILDDDTIVIVVSDHGMVRQNGKINVNDFLIKEGYLVPTDEFLDKAKEKYNSEKVYSKFKTTDIDWTKTLAYEVGAYQARIYLNSKKRSPQGIINDEDYEKIRNEIAEKLASITDDKGNKINNKIYKPEDVYHAGYSDESPDFYVFFDDLKWGVNNDGIGSNKVHLVGDEAGNDNAGHHPIGSLIISGGNIKNSTTQELVSIYDIAPTILKLLGLDLPLDLRGKPINLE